MEILGNSLLAIDQADQIHALLCEGSLCTGSDGSEKDCIWDHAYGFSSGRIEGKVWGGAAVTSGNLEEMALLRTELGWGGIWMLLVVYILHVQRGTSS